MAETVTGEGNALRRYQPLLVSPKARPKKRLSLGLSRGSKMLAASLSSKSMTPESSASSFFRSSLSPSLPPFKRPSDTIKSPLRDKQPLIPNKILKSSPPLDHDLLSITTAPPPQKKSRMESPEGFVNLGNTCYLNAVLQSLLGLRCFALDLVQCNLGPSVDSQSLFRMLYLLVKCKYNGDGLASQIILIKNIRRIICQRAKEFYGFNEQDAHELLTHCLNILRTDIAPFISHNTSVCPVEVNFRCCVQQNITCLKCQSIITNFEEVLDLPLNFVTPDRNSLQELLEDYFQSETVEYKCRSCGHNQCRLSRQFSTLPRVLILTLKRYALNDYGSCDKRLEPVRLPRYLNLIPVSKPDACLPTPYDNSQDILGPLMGKVVDRVDLTSPLQEKKRFSYRLTSVISHYGKLSSSGHYVSEVYCPVTNNWWHCNDSKVSLTTEEHVRQLHQTKAYILFYIHH